MAQQERDNKLLIYGEDVKKAVLEGAKAVYKAVTTTYGAKGRNVLLEKTYGRPVLTRDGVTVAKEVYFKDRPKNMAAQLVVEASQTTNRVAGDGTSATVALTYHLVKEALKNDDPMQARETINADAQRLLDEIAKVKSDVKSKDLTHVASISGGNKALGKLIADAVKYVGKDGGLITEKAHITGVEREYVDGYFLQQGFTAISEGRRELENPYVVVASKPITSNADVIELLQRLVEVTETGQNEKLRLALFGEIEGEAYQTIVANILKGTIDATVVKTPSTGDMGVHYLEDIAIYTGGKLITEGTPFSEVDKNYLGSAKKVTCDQQSCSIFDGKFDKDEYTKRLKVLKSRADKEENEHLLEKVRDRIAKLEGKIALFKIGGATDTEKEEKEFRIEDAIQATRAAHQYGVVPGGGIVFLHLSRVVGISGMFQKALRSTFKQLLKNANFEAEVKLREALDAGLPMGFNLVKGDKLVDMTKEGILDPALVIEQVVKNSASIAGNIATMESMIIFEDKKEE